MDSYSLSHWILIFFFYCFCGWVWESCYVSLLKRRWVNRGFLQGPLLPIYGSGAITVILVTYPVRENPVLVALIGMISATILEYVTGAVLERIFYVRYWDYSNQKFQLNGYICLSSSLAWGLFSFLLIDYVEPPVGRMIARIPHFVAEPVAIISVIFFTIDVVRSAEAAFDLRDVLKKMTEENEEFRKLAKRAEVFAAFAEEDLREFHERTEINGVLHKHIMESSLWNEKGMKRRLRVEKRLENVLEVKLRILDHISLTVENSMNRFADLHEFTEEQREEMNDILEHVSDIKYRIRMRTARNYKRALRILHANPSASSRSYREGMEMLRKIEKDSEKEESC